MIEGLVSNEEEGNVTVDEESDKDASSDLNMERDAEMSARADCSPE